MTKDPAKLAEDVARHDAEIVAIGKGLSRVESTVAGFSTKLDEIATAVSSSRGGEGRASVTTILTVVGLLIASVPVVLSLIGGAAAILLYLIGQNEQRVERLEAAHALEVARNNVVEYRQGATEMFQRLVIDGKLGMP